MAPSGKGYPPPVPRVLRRTPGDGSPPPQPQPSQEPSQALTALSRSLRNPSPTFPNLIPRSTPRARDIDPRLVSVPESQPQSHQDTSRASSRIQSRTGSSRPPPQDNSLPRPRDLIPRPGPRAIPHLVPRPRLTPMDRDLILGQGQTPVQTQGQTQIRTQVPEDQDEAQTGTGTRASERSHFQGQGQFQIQLQAQQPPHIDQQIRVQNHDDFYANYPSPFPTRSHPFSDSQTTIAPRDQNLHQESHRNLHQRQFPTQVPLETQNQDQNFYDNYPFPFPTPQNPFSNYQAGVSSRDQELHRGTHRDLVQAPTSVQAQDEPQIRNLARASKHPRLSYSNSHPNSSRSEESQEGNRDKNRKKNGNETSNEIGTENETRNATQNERCNPKDTSSESPLSTPPDSVSTSPALAPLRNFPRFGSFSQSQRFDRSPTSSARARGGHSAKNGNRNVTASRTGNTNLLSSFNPSNPYTEPPILPSTLDVANCPTAAQKKWMYAVRKEGRRSDRNENGGFGRGIEGQMVRLFGGGGEGGV
ncbi:uncharacterized protein EAE98_006154 [Botrytis deweyae]|uniref:Uncharacterized protein n=1 Tax=Botrytis deweyae TaxID=2478750 RepID=A0ABQ7IM15_9HELO|nr:uncharacterized protein EAE98_006154 [Botrytis deweyae]KAF7927772.1 hypothetical protein EAE98_006154 [Botrytis deweyae]